MGYMNRSGMDGNLPGKFAFLSVLFEPSLSAFEKIDLNVVAEGALKVELLHGGGCLIARCVLDRGLAKAN